MTEDNQDLNRDLRFVDLNGAAIHLRKRYDILIARPAFQDNVKNFVCNAAFLKLGAFEQAEKAALYDMLIKTALYMLQVTLENLSAKQDAGEPEG